MCLTQKENKRQALLQPTHSLGDVTVRRFWLPINENLAPEMNCRCLSLYPFAFWERDQQSMLQAAACRDRGRTTVILTPAY